MLTNCNNRIHQWSPTSITSSSKTTIYRFQWHPCISGRTQTTAMNGFASVYSSVSLSVCLSISLSFLAVNEGVQIGEIFRKTAVTSKIYNLNLNTASTCCRRVCVCVSSRVCVCLCKCTSLCLNGFLWHCMDFVCRSPDKLAARNCQQKL